MPTFFDQSTLTAEQKARWDGAVLEYTRVQNANVDRLLRDLTLEARKHYATAHGATTDAQIRPHIASFERFKGNSPGHPKSGLFARLLAGKDALEFPPPLSYSYPWYSVVEGAEAHVVHVAPGLNAADLPAEFQRKDLPFALSINQHGWAVVSMNSAAQQLTELNQELRSLRMAAQGNLPQANYGWTQDLYQRVLDAYRQKPEFVVQCPHWEPYRLFVAHHKDIRNAGTCKRRIALQAHAGLNRNQKHSASVYDLNHILLNVEVGATVSKGEDPRKVLENYKLQLKEALQDAAGVQSNADYLKRLIVAKSTTLKDEVEAFEAMPDGEDLVTIYTDAWHLKKLSV